MAPAAKRTMAALLLGGGLALAGVERPAPAEAPAVADPARALAAIDDRLDGLIDADDLLRRDGCLYAVDVGLLILGEALGGDRSRYQRLTDLARRELVVEKPAGLDLPAVVWRRRPGQAPDASGTTEALALAEALLVGAARFARPADAALAGRLLQGYVAHAAVDNGTWIVRNYYNFGTRTFATNSFLVDYGPDLLVYAAARWPDDKRLRPTAERSVALVRAAQRPNGLIDAIVQPELKTLFSFVIHSPNDVVELEHTVLVAHAAAAVAPEVGRRVLDFVRPRLADLRTTYVGTSGVPHGPRKATAGTFAALARLAAKLGDRPLLASLRAPLAAHATTLARDDGAFDLHAAAETALGLHTLILAEQNRTLPLAIAAPALPRESGAPR
jgi:hypothetical protein